MARETHLYDKWHINWHFAVGYSVFIQPATSDSSSEASIIVYTVYPLCLPAKFASQDKLCFRGLLSE